MARFYHRDFECEIDDAWWRDAGMMGFVPKRSSYRAGPPEPHRNLVGHPVVSVRVCDVAPVRRGLAHGVFRDAASVTRFLIGFRHDDEIPPALVSRLPAGTGHAFRLTHGGHRFYCSVAAGYSEVPAIVVPDSVFEDL